jgi:hypothetical protein
MVEKLEKTWRFSMKHLLSLIAFIGTAAVASAGGVADPFINTYQDTGGFASAPTSRVYAHNTVLRAREDGIPVELVLPNDTVGSTVVPALPASIDWGYTADNPLSRNVMSAIRDQGNCGSCWAFGTVAAVEAWANVARNSSITDLAEEYLVKDCCSAGDCSGGYVSQASDFLVNTGSMPEQCFPYTASDGICAGYCPASSMMTTNSWGYAGGNWWTIDINAIKEALVRYGPMPAAMEVYEDFYAYAGGIYQHASGSYLGGHCITITGYVDNDEVAGGGYFIVRNSWGTGWGEDGYFAVAYDSNCDFGIEATYYVGGATYLRTAADNLETLSSPPSFLDAAKR